MNQFDDKEAMIKAYDSLIQSHRDILEEYIDEYNTEMIRQAMAKIQSDLIENGIPMSIKLEAGKDLTTIQYNVELWKQKLKNLEESKERMVK